MATKAQLDRLASRVEALAIALDPKPPVEVTVFLNETADFAMQRHRELRPEHAGRRVSLVYDRLNERWDGGEYYAVWLSAEEDRDAWRAYMAANADDILGFKAEAIEGRFGHGARDAGIDCAGRTRWSDGRRCLVLRPAPSS
jgi:hypothetical protein